MSECLNVCSVGVLVFVRRRFVVCRGGGAAPWFVWVRGELCVVCGSCGSVRVRVGLCCSVTRQLGRAVKAIDSKSIGVTRVSSNLTAVDSLLNHNKSTRAQAALSSSLCILRAAPAPYGDGGDDPSLKQKRRV